MYKTNLEITNPRGCQPKRCRAKTTECIIYSHKHINIYPPSSFKKITDPYYLHSLIWDRCVNVVACHCVAVALLYPPGEPWRGGRAIEGEALANLQSLRHSRDRQRSWHHWQGNTTILQKHFSCFFWFIVFQPQAANHYHISYIYYVC